MQNNYNRQYLSIKSQHDEQIKELRLEQQLKLKQIRDTNANKIKTEKQQALARTLASLTDSQYDDKQPIAAPVTQPTAPLESITLPPLKSQGQSSRQTKSVTGLSKQSKYNKKVMAEDL